MRWKREVFQMFDRRQLSAKPIIMATYKTEAR